MSKKALGRGIEALIRDSSRQEEGRETGIEMVQLERLQPSEHQPRVVFPKEQLQELADSIRQKGILQPLLAERRAGGEFVIIAGERRFRAAKMAGLKAVPVLIRSSSDTEKMEIALIENLQRENLKPCEEAAAFQQLMQAAGLKQEEIAERVGKKRSTVANSLRLLKLPEPIREALDDGRITPGHARAILSLTDSDEQLQLFQRICERQLSVRQAEQLAAERGQGKPADKGKEKAPPEKRQDPNLKAVEERLIEKFGTKVSIRTGGKGGRIEISFYSSEDLERVLELLAPEGRTI